jgi:hypothetical protein
VDDFVDDYKADPYARWMLMLFRLPATLQILARKYIFTRLFCTYAGRRFRVTGASRIGDVWLVADHSKDSGYDHRADVDECSAWGDAP